MKKNYFKSFLIMLMLMCSTFTALAVDYALGGYLNGQDVNNYDGNWKFTQSGSNYVLTKTFSKTDNYFWIFDSNGTKYGVDSYTENNPSTLKQGANEKVGAKGLSTSSATTITFNPSTKQISWSNSSGPIPSASDLYIIGDAIEGWNDASEKPIFKAMTKGSNGEFYYENVASERQFKFTTQDNWSDASQSLYNESSADNTKSVGSTITKVGNDNNLQVSVEQGYIDPITFYVNSSTKKFWSVATKKVNFDLTASKTDYDTANAPTELTLKVEADNTTTGDFIWYQSADGKNFTEIAGVTGDTYTLSGDDVPMVDTYFKVKRAKADNTTPAPEYLEDTVKISVFQTCGEGTKGSNLFKITFDHDTLTTLIGAGSRMSYDAMVGGYTYVEAPYKINDGQYAIVTEPLYCGYCEGGKDECGTDLGCIDEKIKESVNNRWYRGFRDHTQNKGGANPPYGGMLLINFGDIKADDEESGVAFSKILGDEAEQFVTGSTLSFSAFMASAAVKEKTGVTFAPIDAELKIQFKQTDKTTWETVANIKSQVEYDDNWKRFETSWKIERTDGEFRVVIKNNGSTGSGNDLLIDDISLDLCIPTLSLHFVDKEGNAVENLQPEKIGEAETIRIPNGVFGSLGDDPCIQIYKRYPKEEPTTTDTYYYEYLADLTLDAEKKFYTVEVNNVNILLNNDGSAFESKAEIIALATPKNDANECDSSYKDAMKSGRYQPGSEATAVFSSNFLTYSYSCADGSIKLSSEDDVCYRENATDMTLPTATLEYKAISNDSRYDFIVNGDIVIKGASITSDETKVDLKTLKYNYTDDAGAFNEGDAYKWEISDDPYAVQFNYYDLYSEATTGNSLTVCEGETSNDLEFNIINCADVKVIMEPETAVLCIGDTVQREFRVYNYSPAPVKNVVLVIKSEAGISIGEKSTEFIFEVGEIEAYTAGSEDVPFRGQTLKISRDKNTVAGTKNITAYIKSIDEDVYDSYEASKFNILVPITFTGTSPDPTYTTPYLACASDEEVEATTLITNASGYESIKFYSDKELTTEITKIGFTESKTYYFIAESKDLCPTDIKELEVQSKPNSKAVNIEANDANICPNTAVKLSAAEKFSETQNNVVFKWYSDATLETMVKEGAEYSLSSVSENKDYYVTVTTDSYCENLPADAKKVSVTLKPASPQISLEPKEQVIAIGGVAELKVSPAEVSTAPQLQLYANDVLQGEGPVRPYIDTEYKMIYNGECGVTSAKANVTVQWPTVFTPYVKDGRNDTFVKDMDPNFYTKIFTRFGTKIYESDNGWDGSVGGSMNGSKDVAAPGVYYYVVELPDGNVKKGTIEVFKY